MPFPAKPAPSPSVLSWCARGALAEGCELHIEEQQAECWCEQCQQYVTLLSSKVSAAHSVSTPAFASWRMTGCRSNALKSRRSKVCVSTCGCAEGNLYIEGMNTVLTPRFAPPLLPPHRVRQRHSPGFALRLNAPIWAIFITATARAGTHAPGMSQRQMLNVEINVLDKNRSPPATAPGLPHVSSWCSTSSPAPARQNHAADGNAQTPERARLLRGDRRRSANGQRCRPYS